MQTDNIITYGFFVQEVLQEYNNIVESKRWEHTDSRKTCRYEPLLMMDSNVAIGYPVNKTVENLYFKNLHKGKDNKSVIDSSTKSVVTCHKCGKKVH